MICDTFLQFSQTSAELFSSLTFRKCLLIHAVITSTDSFQVDALETDF